MGELAPWTGTTTRRLADLGDVAVAGEQAGDLLLFNGEKWVRLPKGNAGESMIVHSNGTVTYEKSVIYAKAWGVAGTEAAGEGTAANEALAAAGAAGAEVKFPAGTILCNETVKNRAKCHMRGGGVGATVFKTPAGTNIDAVSTLKAGEGGQDECSWSDFQVDGNGANNLVAGRGLVIDGRKPRASNVWVHDCRGDNILYTQSAADLPKESGGMDFYLDNWLSWGSKSGNGLTIDHHDATVRNGQAIFNKAAGVETTATGYTTKLEFVHTWGATEYGFRFKASFQAIHCEAEGAEKAQVRCEAGGTWIGGQVFTSNSSRNVPGFQVTQNAARLQVVGCTGKELGTGGMFQAAGASAGSGSVIVGCICDGGGLEPFTKVFTVAEGASWSGNVSAEVRMRGNAEAGEWPVQSLAAANELVIDSFLRACRITGATEIKKVKGTWAGHVVRFRMTSTAKWVDGENLKLAGNFEGGENRTLTLEYDGTNWQECGRSAN